MFEIAFQMFDLNGDGEVSPEEFEKVGDLCWFTFLSLGCFLYYHNHHLHSH